MENYKDIIIRPIITEKTMRYMDADNKVTFEVKKGTNKTQVKQAVEAIFGVDVEKVNIVNVKPKTKRMGKYVGTTKNVRKAYVKIKEGQDINLFGEARYFLNKYCVRRKLTICQLRSISRPLQVVVV